MKIINLDGSSGYLDTRPSHFPLRSEKSSKSKIQYEAGKLLKEKFPMDAILEEVPIPKERLTIDFLMPTKKLAFEVQGNQHDTFVAHFHKNAEGFKRSQERDNRKQRWCEINDIELIYIYNLEEFKYELFG